MHQHHLQYTGGLAETQSLSSLYRGTLQATHQKHTDISFLIRTFCFTMVDPQNQMLLPPPPAPVQPAAGNQDKQQQQQNVPPVNPVNQQANNVPIVQA